MFLLQNLFFVFEGNLKRFKFDDHAYKLPLLVFIDSLESVNFYANRDDSNHPASVP